MLGFHSLGNYGPFQSPWHVQMLGFRIWGLDRDWADHVRGNHLLSLYGVKYILAADPEYRAVLESVTIPTDAPPPDGDNLLVGPWESGDVARRFGALADADGSGPDTTLRLRTPFLWWMATLSQPVAIPSDGVYTLSFDARAPDGGATLFLQAALDHADTDPRHAWYEAEELSAPAQPGQPAGTAWRRFECAMAVTRKPQGQPQRLTFATLSERVIEIRNVQLRPGHRRGPINFNGTLPPGGRVYELVAELPARDPSHPPVAMYKNLLAQPIPTADRLAAASSETVDALKFLDETTTTPPARLPDISLPPVRNPKKWFLLATLPATAVWLGTIALAGTRRKNTFS